MRAALVLLLALSACKSNKVETRATIEEAPRLASMVRMGDPNAAGQLTSGLYQVEDNAWRWTSREFAVTLGPPPGAAQKGAVLSLDVSIPDPVIEKLKTVTLTASLSGVDLPPQTYTRTGRDVYKRDVPVNLLAGGAIRIDFRLDKALPPGGGDLRELGIVVLSAGLEAK